jgi:hypothetical protein
MFTTFKSCIKLIKKNIISRRRLTDDELMILKKEILNELYDRGWMPEVIDKRATGIKMIRKPGI